MYSLSAATFSSAPDLELGDTHPFVTTLQQFLNSNGYTVNSIQGEPGSTGYESNYFGVLTQKALSLFQTKNDITPAQGYFGTKTKGAMDGMNVVAVKQGALSSGSVTAPTYTTGSAQIVNSFPDACCRTMDLPPATLKKNSTEFYTWTNNGEGSFKKYKGTLADPLATTEWSGGIDGRWTIPDTLKDYGTPLPDVPKYRPWLGNIYKIDNSTLIGFVHIETGYWEDEDYRFRIGIAISRDAGNNWRYLGDVLKPKYDEFSNMGGTPLLIVTDKVGGVDTDFFYLYFNEMPIGGPRIPAVARAKVSDVVTAALSNTVTPWVKYNRNTGGWVENGKTGVASNITWNIDNTSGNSSNPTHPDRYDMHTDAVYSTALGKYVLLGWEQAGYNFYPPYATSTANKGIYAYTSTDGINWGDKRHIFTPTLPGAENPYPFFAGGLTDPNTTDDFNVIGGNDFYIYFPDRINNGLYRLPFHVDNGTVVNSFTLSLNPTAGGTITSNQASQTIPTGTSVTLTANPSSGYTFTNWSGGTCSGTSATCSFTMDGNKSVTATFTSNTNLPKPAIPVISTPSNANTVFSVGTRDVEINWNNVTDADTYYVRAIEYVDSSKTATTTRRYSGNTDDRFYYLYKNNNSASDISLPVDDGRYYDFWVHAVNENGFSTSTNISFSVSNVVTPVNYTVTVNKVGSGTVKINGVEKTSDSFSAGSTVTLTADPSSGHSFSGWSGGVCSGLNTTCTLTVNGDKTVTATFVQNSVTPPTTTIPSVLYPTANQKLSATNSLTVQWTGSSSRYLIRLKDESTSAPALMEEVGGTSKTYTVIPGHTYHFWMHPGSMDEYVLGITPQVERYFEVNKEGTVVTPPITPPVTPPASSDTFSASCTVSDTSLAIGEQTIIDITTSNLPAKYKLTWSGISTSKVKGFNKKNFDQILTVKKKGTLKPTLLIKNTKNSKEKVKVECAGIRVN